MPRDPHWPLPGDLRMPLQIGRSALVEATFFCAAALGALSLAIAHMPDGEDAATVVTGALLLLALVWLWISRTSLVGSRASDLVLGPGGFRIDGGPRHGLHFRWSELDPHRCRVENDKVADPTGAPLRGNQLVLGTRDGRDVLAAETWQADDLEALYVAVDEIRAMHGLPPLPGDQRTRPQRAPDAPAAAPATDTTLLRCDRCGAAAVPADMPQVTCPMCQQAIAVPDDVRRELAAEAALADERARGMDLVRLLLDQPGAATTNRWLTLTMLVLFALPVATGLGFLELRLRGGGGGALAFGAWVACAAVCCIVYHLASPMLTRRVALRACLVELGARHEDGPRCRACGAALTDLPAGHTLARCPYCRCDNILGVDLRPWQNAEAGRHGSLRQLLDERGTRLRGRWSDLLLCLVFAVIGGLGSLIQWTSL